MVAIQVRDISDESRDALAAEADYRGVSLQVFLHDILEREAASARNVAWVRAQRGRAPMYEGGPSTRELIEQGRRERDRAILDAIGFHDVPVIE
jgi:hypothetical protein